jgi:hypothetical protein
MNNINAVDLAFWFGLGWRSAASVNTELFTWKQPQLQVCFVQRKVPQHQDP